MWGKAIIFYMAIASCCAYNIFLNPGRPEPDGTCKSKKASASALLKSKKNDPKFWVPECDKSGNYLLVQKRQDKEQFCVEPQTGAIVDWKAPQPKKPTDSIYCDCFVANFISNHNNAREYVVTCDKATGFYTPFQQRPPMQGSYYCSGPRGERDKKEPKSEKDCLSKVG